MQKVGPYGSARLLANLITLSHLNSCVLPWPESRVGGMVTKDDNYFEQWGFNDLASTLRWRGNRFNAGNHWKVTINCCCTHKVVGCVVKLTSCTHYLTGCILCSTSGEQHFMFYMAFVFVLFWLPFSVLQLEDNILRSTWPLYQCYFGFHCLGVQVCFPLMYISDRNCFFVIVIGVVFSY